MNSVELLLVDLVRIAEAPLYPAYRWLGRELGRLLPMEQFLRLLADLMHADVLQLWQVDYKTHDRAELFVVPEDLEQQYREVRLDEQYDPYGLSLTLGPAASIYQAPEWEVDLDFDRLKFELHAHAVPASSALDAIARYLPDIALVVERQGQRTQGMLLVGRLELE